MTQIFIPTSGFHESEHKSWLKDLFFVPYDEMSVREKAKIDQAIEHGEIYVGEYTKLASGIQVLSTDLGSPKETERVEIRFPPYIAKERAVYMLMGLVEDIMECPGQSDI